MNILELGAIGELVGRRRGAGDADLSGNPGQTGQRSLAHRGASGVGARMDSGEPRASPRAGARQPVRRGGEERLDVVEVAG